MKLPLLKTSVKQVLYKYLRSPLLFVGIFLLVIYNSDAYTRLNKPVIPDYSSARNEPKLESVNMIWNGAPHNAFTSLTRYKDHWYCAFREAGAHTTWDGAIRILRSKDGTTWTSVKEFRMAKTDLRDPRLCITPSNKLMILFGGQVYDSATRRPVYQGMVSFSKDGSKWKEAEKTNVADRWLYDIVWNKGYAYTISYNCKGTELRLYKSRDGVKYKYVCDMPAPKGAGEIALAALPDGKLAAFARCDSLPKLGSYGESSHPFTNWDFKPTPYPIMAGPKLLITADGAIKFACARSFENGKPYTILARSNPDGSFSKILTLPSGGDTSYAGMVWHDNMLWISYYSSHEGQTKIYLAKVSFVPKVASVVP